MSGAPRKRCPVCWQRVYPTQSGMIEAHWDSIGRDVCPMSGESYELGQVGKRRIVWDYRLTANELALIKAEVREKTA